MYIAFGHQVLLDKFQRNSKFTLGFLPQYFWSVTGWFYLLLQALDWAVQDLPILHGVTYLELDDLTFIGFSLIPRFLKSAPNLKKAVATIPVMYQAYLDYI